MATYTDAIAQLERDFDRALEKDIVYNNKYEVYCVSKGILPTEGELQGSEEFAYDWFMALYYNQPHLLQDPAITTEFITSVLEAAIQHSAGDAVMRYMVAHELAKRSTK